MKYRDVEMIPLNEEDVLVIGCDSCGAIGLKEGDIVKVAPYKVGKYTARVSLMEIVSLGAEVVSMTVNICNELNPTGEEMLKGVKSELKECDLNIPMIISTEKNMKTSMTALGVSVIGVGKNENLLMNHASCGDFVYVMGIPKVGDEVVADEGEIADIISLKQVLEEESVKEIIPIGSLGIKGELDKFLKAHKLSIQYENNLKLPLEKTAGPCTAMIIISHTEIKNTFKVPVTMIGKLFKN